MNPALEKRLKRQVIGKSHRFLAVVPLGFEQTFVNELECIRQHKASETHLPEREAATIEQPHIIGDGKVEFTTKLTDAWKIVAYSRIANRVLMHIADFKAENFRELEKKAAEIPFELYIDERRETRDERYFGNDILEPKAIESTQHQQQNLSIHVACKHSRLYHSDAVAERLQKAIEDSLSKGGSLPLASVSPDNAKTKVGVVRQAHQPEHDSRACRGGEPSATPSAGTPRNAPKSEASSESKARPLTPWFDRLTNRFIAVASEPTHQNLYVNLIDDRCTIWLDLAGEELYKRGFERFVNDAPLKETIAAAMIFEAIHCMDPIGTPCLQDDRLQDDRNGVATLTTNHQPLATLLDPMSGSGTFSLEAACIAHNIIPGVCRDFALMHLPAFKEATWNFIIRRENRHSPTDERREMATATIVKIVTSDIDERSIKIIKHNVECSPLADIASNGNSPTITPQLRDFFSYTAKEIAETCGDTSPILVLNPPYGKRLDFDAPKLYTKIGKKLAELACELKAFGKPLTVAILAPKDDAREGSKYTCTTNLLRECPALAPNKKSTAKLIETSHGGFSLNVFIAKI